MKRQLAAGLLSTLAWISPFAFAQNDVFVCIDAEGNREYKNTGPTSRCKKVDLPEVTTVPAPLPKRVTAAQNSSEKASSPPDFPRVENAIQKARDSDRKQILMDELKNEQEKLVDLRVEYNNGDPERLGNERNYAKYQERKASLKEDIDRTEKNVEALRRELNNLR